MPSLLGHKCSCAENPTVLFSNNDRSISCESPFFPLNIGMPHLMSSIDRNARLINNKPIYSAVVILMQMH
jgi:hypothetical protein